MKFSKEEKLMWLDDWKQSGLSVCAYARKNGLNQQTFRNWVNEKSCTGFVEVTNRQIKADEKRKEKIASVSSEILVEKGGLKIHIPFINDGSSFKTLLSFMAGQL